MKMLRGTVFLSTFSSSRFFHSSSFSNHPQTLYKERSLTLNVGHWTFSTDLNSLCCLYLYLVSIQDFHSVQPTGEKCYIQAGFLHVDLQLADLSLSPQFASHFFESSQKIISFISSDVLFLSLTEITDLINAFWLI